MELTTADYVYTFLAVVIFYGYCGKKMQRTSDIGERYGFSVTSMLIAAISFLVAAFALLISAIFPINWIGWIIHVFLVWLIWRRYNHHLFD